jgi:OmpA-OmpF porin, OOP family
MGENAIIWSKRVMPTVSKSPKTYFLLAALPALVLAVPGGVFAQQDKPEGRDIIVTGQPEAPEVDPNAGVLAASGVKGPEVRGIISARSGNRMQVTTDDGTKTIIAINEATRIKSGGSLFGSNRNKLTEASLLNGLPVTIKTVQAGDQLVASQINLRSKDFRTANMIRSGTSQGFAEQSAATEALRGRMADIDEYNIKDTTNVNFAVGKAVLTEQGKADLCATVSAAGAMKNSLILVVGYTDSTGSDDYNQQLSEKRASRVVNHIQQACGWKPYRMLTPTGMSESAPLASNDTADGKAQNRRVAVNVLVSKGLDGL